MKGKNTYFLKSGETVCSFCRRNEINYATVWERLARGDDPDELVEKVLKRRAERPEKKIYFHNGESLWDFCKRNKIGYDLVLTYWKRHEKELTLEEAVDVYLTMRKEGRKTLRMKYFVDGVPLTDYCERNGLDPDRVRAIYKMRQKKGEPVTLEQAIEIQKQILRRKQWL